MLLYSSFAFLPSLGTSSLDSGNVTIILGTFFSFSFIALLGLALAAKKKLLVGLWIAFAALRLVKHCVAPENGLVLAFIGFQDIILVDG